MEKLYGDLAAWWPLVSPVEDYADEARFFRGVLSECGLPPTPTLLELGAGAGSNAFYLKHDFAQVTLTDLSPQMLELSRARNPDCKHILADMRTLRLGRSFDIVFVHDAIDYMTTLSELRQAIETAYVHLRPGGAALFVPDHVRESFAPSTDHAGQDGGGRALRYMDWTFDPDPADSTYITEYVYVLHEPGQPTRVEYDRHMLGLFARGEWLDLLHAVGFQARIVRDPFERHLFVARRPADGASLA